MRHVIKHQALANDQGLIKAVVANHIAGQAGLASLAGNHILFIGHAGIKNIGSIGHF